MRVAGTRPTVERALVGIAIGAVVVVAILLGWRPVYSFDVGFYLDIGRRIAETGAIPFSDELTFTRAGTPVDYYAWLFDIVSWGFFRLGGASALIAATIAGYLVAIGLLLHLCRARSGRIGAGAVLLVLLFCLGSF